MQSRDVEAVVIGAGTAGANAFHVLKSAGVDVLLVDPGPLGTTCARVGCMPSKAVLHAAARWSQARGLVADPADLILSPNALWQHARQVRDELAGEAAQSTRSAAGHRLIMQEARFVAADTLQAGQTRIRARAFVICTGSSPVVPEPLRSLEHRLLTTDTLFELDVLPRRVGVLGMGAIGLEMGIALARLGLDVIGADQSDDIGGATDPDIQARAQVHFGSLMQLWLGEAVTAQADGDAVRLRQADRQAVVDRLLVATGRHANVEKLDLAAAGVDLDDKGQPRIDPERLTAGHDGIFFAGDVNPDRPLMHEAADEGQAAGRAALAHVRGESPPALARRCALAIVFTDPDLCAIGLPFDQAQEQDAFIGAASGNENGRARIMGANDSLLRVYAARGTGRLLGASILATHGEHLAHLLGWAIQNGQTAEQLLAMPFYHPSIEEMLKDALKDAVRQMKP
ncbi:pyridine nucleotide-disulfide oxidoreductase [Bordetella ansorpii]|uniref:Pyridine nucleotide-disulfide oxidoreductase n=1 Tax=Bordetella ansorpii TaxID=288768 RepID=A0A157SI24_9BORD|nr:dihydrolipoyl dehydrogenase [Bordetella ansorpii]SAI69566.1 pyridine nucleotide-disulfide oxidoreductase [Bordetella ansorpii]